MDLCKVWGNPFIEVLPPLNSISPNNLILNSISALLIESYIILSILGLFFPIKFKSKSISVHCFFSFPILIGLPSGNLYISFSSLPSGSLKSLVLENCSLIFLTI